MTTRNIILEKIPYGLYVVGSKAPDGFATIVANWVSQVSFSPTLLSVSIEEDSDMKSYIELSNYFSVNMLSKESIQVAKAFLKKSVSNGTSINGHDVTLTTHGSPYLTHALASLECKIVNSIVVGDHVLFLGEIVEAVSQGAGKILTLEETGWKYSR